MILWLKIEFETNMCFLKSTLHLHESSSFNKSATKTNLSLAEQFLSF